jgi:hypothetical protein
METAMQDDVYQRCTDILLEETGLLTEINSLQAQVQNAVQNREWADFELYQSALDEAGEKLSVMEAERTGLFSFFSSEIVYDEPDSPIFDPSSGFFAVHADTGCLSTAQETTAGDEANQDMVNTIDGGFYRLASHFPEEKQRDITDAYRALKMGTLRVKMAGESFMNYLGEVQGLMKGFLEAAFPDRRGNLYNRMGRQASADMRSMVLDRSF